MKFRENYLSKLANFSDGRCFITDKMPHNFLLIPLICAAFPEAKIIHVQRDPRAVCWSSFKKYFPAGGIKYCYSLTDLVLYYELYTDLMKKWQSQYCDRIYNLNYEKLTIDQNNETRKLISHLGLGWQEACLYPHENKRGVKTASQLQVRKKVYQGSSQAWRKYEPFLDNIFESLPTN